MLDGITFDQLTDFLLLAASIIGIVFGAILSLAFWSIKKSFEGGRFYNMINNRIEQLEKYLSDISKDMSKMRALYDSQKDQMNLLEGRIIALEVRTSVV